MIKVSIHEEDITIINIYAPDNRAPKIHEVKTVTIKERNRQRGNSSWILQHCTFNNGQKN